MDPGTGQAVCPPCTRNVSKDGVVRSDTVPGIGTRSRFKPMNLQCGKSIQSSSWSSLRLLVSVAHHRMVRKHLLYDSTVGLNEGRDVDTRSAQVRF